MGLVSFTMRSISLGRLSFTFTPKNVYLLNQFSAQFAYGHREILLSYARLDSSTLLEGVLQHGITSNENLLLDAKTPKVGLFRRAPFWVFSKETTEFLKNHGMRDVTAIGAPWAYLQKMRGQLADVGGHPKRNKTLVFPTHYSQSVNIPFTQDEVRQKLRRWKSLSGGEEITICLLWSEFLNPVWRMVCESEGVTLTFAGVGESKPVWSPHVSRVNFLANIDILLRDHSRCIFESPTSAIFYAISLGKEIGLFLSPQSGDWGAFSAAHERQLIWTTECLPDLVEKFALTPRMIEFSRRVLGEDCILNPEELRENLVYSKGVVPT